LVDLNIAFIEFIGLQCHRLLFIFMINDYYSLLIFFFLETK